MKDANESRQQALEIHQQGDFASAEVLYREILNGDPTDGETWHYLAVLRGQQNRPADVVECCKQALRHGYAAAAVHANLALAQRLLGQLELAKSAFADSFALNPTDLELILEYVDLLMQDGDEYTSLRCLNDACKRFPSDPRLQAVFGQLASQLNNGPLAETQFRHVVDLLNPSGDSGSDALFAASTNGDASQSAEAWVNLGSILQMRGDVVSARRAYRQALKLKPDFEQVYWYLAQFATDQEHQLFADHIIEKARSTAAKNSAPIQFAAAKVHHDAGDIAAAFAAYRRGNQLVRRSFQYRIDTDVAALTELSNSLGSLNSSSIKWEDLPAQPKPIFIVGMPRSGSTLIEQMLARHPSVAAGGEIVWMQRFVHQLMKKRGLRFPQEQHLLQRADLTEIRDRYLAALELRHYGKPFITDKLPANGLLIPTIRQLFPTAIVVHAKRDPLEACWSCYRHLFSGQQNFAYDLTELGHYAKALHRYLASCQQQWPETVVELSHESLIEDPEQQLRNLLQLLNLVWNQACLTPQNSDGIIQTASALQIRQGISSQPHQNAAMYQEYLKPLLDALGPENSGPNSDDNF